ncbi:MAG: TonB family protein [Pseudorhodoplanes sp.]
MIDWRDPDGRPDHKITLLAALRWTVAVALIAAAHGSAVWIALNWRPAVAAGEPPSSIMIELASLPVAAEAEQDVAPGPQMTEAQPEPTPEALPDPVEKPEEKPEPLTPKPQEVEVPKLPEIEKAEAVLTPPASQPPPVETSPPKAKEVERKKPIEPKRRKAPQTTAPPKSQAQRANRTAAPFSSAAVVPSISLASWRGAVMGHLNRHKRFPGGTASTGTVHVVFSIDRSGRVLSSRLAGSSGDSVLDAEAVSLPRRSSPVPAPPPNIGGQTISLSVPVRFNR